MLLRHTVFGSLFGSLRKWMPSVRDLLVLCLFEDEETEAQNNEVFWK